MKTMRSPVPSVRAQKTKNMQEEKTYRSSSLEG